MNRVIADVTRPRQAKLLPPSSDQASKRIGWCICWVRWTEHT